ncbi:flavin-containing monooxygenase [Hoyosella subflava]|uniref:Possible potassium uptake protein n=1 Tax=Hoyosella subflava (strain DSM 45089 / JCM 17490 / NBRC 109087 / DQS3-9A1) TaxID=443218 RepID=F6EJ24_HOYSD|nr:NAD(P)/FAD-dependent oxidoreductase [Hoyosella subflava]AEF41256.1 Possible potassium uptake protein [Hoyosella subflava DQS3-9A1]
MNTQHIETLIIGAGQCGLSTGYHLQRRNRPFLIVDSNERIGDNWRKHYDSLRLYTPAKYTDLPGMPYPDPERWNYPSRDEVAEYLESYAVRFDLPVRLNTSIDKLTARPEGGYSAIIGGEMITCDNVVIATGTFGRTPMIPEFARELDPSIKQLHSSEYKRPSQLLPGSVLVVGASHSGTDIAYELAETHETTLSGRDCGQLPMRWDTPLFRAGLPVLVFIARHVMTRRTPVGRKLMGEIRTHGGPMLRIKREDLAARGVIRNTSRVTGVRSGRPLLDDGTVADVQNVVWCTGFRQVFDWIDLPVIGDDGWPTEYRGVVRDAPGLFFCGLSFQFAFSSMVFPGVGRDTAYVARRIAARKASSAPARQAA